MRMHGIDWLLEGPGRGGRSLRSGLGGALGACAAIVVLGFSQNARADDPVKAGEPHILAEPGEVTDVVDAFDGDDLFDLHLTIGYQYTTKGAHVRRETYIGQPASILLSAGGYTASNMNVASYSESTSRLNTRLDVGLYHD